MNNNYTFNEEQKAILTEWVTFLEANPEMQGVGALHYEKEGEETEKMCCLGALCHLNQNRLNLTKVVKQNSRRGLDCIYDGANYYLPPTLAIDLFGGNSNPEIFIDNKDRVYLQREARQYIESSVTLSNLNDAGVTWPVIAKLIRKYWLGQNVQICNS